MRTSTVLGCRYIYAALLLGCATQVFMGLSIAKDSDGRVAKLFQKLEGRWKVESAEVSGQKIDSDEEWVFSHGNYKWIDSKREIRGTGSINYTWDPHQIYFQPQHSSITGPISTGDVRNWESGIYKLSDEDNTLTVCLGRLPSKEFATTKEDKRRLYVLKRVKEDKPAR